jgi:undecaprenyl diphosphate synthase
MTEEEKLFNKIISNGNIPEHIAIIMDGNGRWAKERGLPRVAGHNEGINSVREITKACGELGVKHLTLYTFSRENWKRPEKEVNALMQLLVRTIRKEINDLMKNNVRLTIIGQLDELPTNPRKEMIEGIEKTKGNTGLNLNLALNYSSRQEIIDAVISIAKEVKNGLMNLEDINEIIISKKMYTKNMPDPDLLIRTSGESRISNFLLWQLAYTELYITPVYWPAFRKKELYKAIIDFQCRERRFGMVSEQIRKNFS